jgi:UDP-glucose 4-epimerase
MMNMKKALVTGGAGFIGSHIVDRLLCDGIQVVVLDDFSTGFARNLPEDAGECLQVIRGDVVDLETVATAARGTDTVFHFQANADVRGGPEKRRVDLEQNTIATWNVLEACHRESIHTLVFASSATVYGEPEVFPTPEVCQMLQTSLYGASKLACESMIQAYSEYHGMRSLSFRFVSWIGARYSHGVVFDFLKKIRANPGSLEVLGDGSQRKSYLDVRDGIEGIFIALQNFDGLKGVFNLGHDDFLPVLELARIVLEEAGHSGARIHTTGGTRGWVGDSPLVHLDTSRIKALGWKPRIPIEEGIRITARYLLQNPWLLDAR